MKRDVNILKQRGFLKQTDEGRFFKSAKAATRSFTRTVIWFSPFYLRLYQQVSHLVTYNFRITRKLYFLPCLVPGTFIVKPRCQALNHFYEACRRYWQISRCWYPTKWYPHLSMFNRVCLKGIFAPRWFGVFSG